MPYVVAYTRIRKAASTWNIVEPKVVYDEILSACEDCYWLNSRRGSDNFAVMVSDWDGNIIEPADLKVTQAIYEALEVRRTNDWQRQHEEEQKQYDFELSLRGKNCA